MLPIRSLTSEITSGRPGSNREVLGPRSQTQKFQTNAEFEHQTTEVEKSNP